VVSPCWDFRGPLGKSKPGTPQSRTPRQSFLGGCLGEKNNWGLRGRGSGGVHTSARGGRDVASRSGSFQLLAGRGMDQRCDLDRIATGISSSEDLANYLIPRRLARFGQP